MTEIRRRQPAGPTDIIKKFTRFRAARTLAATKTAEADELRDELRDEVLKVGQPYGEKGTHRAIELPEPIDGYERLVTQVKNSPQFNLTKATKIAERKGITSQVTRVRVSFSTEVPVKDWPALEAALKKAGLEKWAPVLTNETVTQDALYAFHQLNKTKLTARDLDSCVEDNITYAFAPEKKR